MSVSQISTNWAIQSMSIKSDLPIFIDLSIDKLIPIFINWLLRVLSKLVKFSLAKVDNYISYFAIDFL